MAEAAPATPKTRQTLPLEVKNVIRQEYRRMQRSAQEMCDWTKKNLKVKVKRSTMYNFMKQSTQEDTHIGQTRASLARFPALERMLMSFIDFCALNRKRITCPILLRKANQLAGGYSDEIGIGWIRSVLRRHEIDLNVFNAGFEEDYVEEDLPINHQP